jgi:hypothetical protein
MSGSEDSTDKPLWMEGEGTGMIEGRYQVAFSLLVRPGGRSVECVHITGSWPYFSNIHCSCQGRQSDPREFLQEVQGNHKELAYLFELIVTNKMWTVHRQSIRTKSKPAYCRGEACH